MLNFDILVCRGALAKIFSQQSFTAIYSSYLLLYLECPENQLRQLKIEIEPKKITNATIYAEAPRKLPDLIDAALRGKKTIIIDRDRNFRI